MIANPCAFFDRAAGLLACAAWFLQIPGDLCAQPPVTKTAFLRETVAAVLQPAHVALRERCLELERATSDLLAAPTPEAWKRARDAWHVAMLAARRVQCYQVGPFVDRDAASSFFSWRLLPARIEAAIASPRPIDAVWIDQMGVGTKGLFACEYLLFEGAGLAGSGGAARTPLAASPGRTNDLRRCQYLFALSQDLAQKAGHLCDDWSRTGDDTPGARFAAGGQETLNGLINQMARSLEDVAEEHLNFVLQMPAPIARQLDRIENARSGDSLASLSERLAGLRELYRGGTGAGIDDYLGQLNAGLRARVEQHIDAAIAALRAVGGPLEEAAMTRRESVQQAYRAVHELELLFKVDLASALGVTITFSSNDGD